jgi:hypothetical protein
LTEFSPLTKAELRAELNAQKLRICAAIGAPLMLGFSVIGALMTLHH